MAASVVVPVGEIADELVDRLVQAAGELKIGNGLDEDVWFRRIGRRTRNVRLSTLRREHKKGPILVRIRPRGRGGPRRGGILSDRPFSTTSNPT